MLVKSCKYCCFRTANGHTPTPKTPHPFYHFVQYLTAFCSRRKAANDVKSSRFMGRFVPDKRFKLCYHRSSSICEIVSRSHWIRHFRQFFFTTTSDRMSSPYQMLLQVRQVCLTDVCLKFSDSGSNLYREIRAAHFMINDGRRSGLAYPCRRGAKIR